MDEIEQIEAQPEQKPKMNVRKNNFFNDDSSVSSSNQSSKSSTITFLKNVERSRSKNNNDRQAKI